VEVLLADYVNVNGDRATRPPIAGNAECYFVARLKFDAAGDVANVAKQIRRTIVGNQKPEATPPKPPFNFSLKH
jgi:hypothetical protein